MVWTHQPLHPVLLFDYEGNYCSRGLGPYLIHGVPRCGLGPCLNHAPLMVLKGGSRHKGSPSTVLRADVFHWGRQGTLLPSSAPIQQDYMPVEV